MAENVSDRACEDISGMAWRVATFLALAIVGMRNTDTQIVRSAYIATDSITWLVIVPLAFASLVTGVVVSLTTPWGLFRHYWVVVKLILSVLATTLLLVHTRPIGMLATAARASALGGPEIGSMQFQLVIDRCRNRRTTRERRVVGIQTTRDDRIWLEKESR